jgi:hypothetical protein
LKIGTSQITNKIYAGNTRKDKSGLELWTKKEDITEQAIDAVFEHMYQLSKETGGFEFSIKGLGKMTFIREDIKEE